MVLCLFDSGPQHSLLRTISVAERVGFEPTVPFPGRVLSKHVDSAALAPLHGIF